jgi:hypothetical protein
MDLKYQPLAKEAVSFSVDASPLGTYSMSARNRISMRSSSDHMDLNG